MVKGKEHLQSASSPSLALVAKTQTVALWLLNDPHARLLLDLKMGKLC